MADDAGFDMNLEDQELLELMGEGKIQEKGEKESVEDALRELKEAYEQISGAVEEEKKKKMEKLKKVIVAQIRVLVDAGYSEIGIKRALVRIGFKPGEADGFIEGFWELERKRKSIKKYLKIVAIAGIGLLLIVGLVALFGLHKTTGSIECKNACYEEILHCKDGKYSFTSGGTERLFIISKEGDMCIVIERIDKSPNKQLVGKYKECKYPIVDGLTQTFRGNCTGTLAGVS